MKWIFFVGIHYRIITTAISEVSSAKEAKTIRSYNTLGAESSHPFKGINIMVTTHTDGTTTAKKNPPLIPHTHPHKSLLTSSLRTQKIVLFGMGGLGMYKGYIS